jgi:Zn-dependent protease with chaperone function
VVGWSCPEADLVEDPTDLRTQALAGLKAADCRYEMREEACYFHSRKSPDKMPIWGILGREMALVYNRRGFICGAAALAGPMMHCRLASASPLDWIDATSIGTRLDRGLREAYTTLNDGELYVKLRRIIHKLAPCFNLNADDIKLCVLVDSEVNALATGGTRMFLFSGMLDLCASEHDLAAVMAHELVHIKHDHLIKRITEAKLTNAAAIALTVGGTIFLSALGMKAYGTPAPFTPNPQPQITQLSVEISAGSFEALNALANVGYSREQEYEADAGAIDALGKAGIDPGCLRAVLERMQVYRGPSLTANGEKHAGALTGHWLNNSTVSIPDRIATLDDVLKRQRTRGSP